MKNFNPSLKLLFVYFKLNNEVLFIVDLSLSYASTPQFPIAKLISRIKQSDLPVSIHPTRVQNASLQMYIFEATTTATKASSSSSL